MEQLTVGCLTPASNATVIQLPQRRFPGVVIQGDSLSILVGTAKRALLALAETQNVDATEALTELCDKLSDYQRVYEDALRREGIPLPY